MNPLHKEILIQIQHHSGKPTQHTFLDSYLGNSHPRYPISIPTLRRIAKEWMKAHKELSVSKFATLLSSLIKGKSSTEICMVGILLDYSTPEQRMFDPKLFNSWLISPQSYPARELCAFSKLQCLSQIYILQFSIVSYQVVSLLTCFIIFC